VLTEGYKKVLIDQLVEIYPYSRSWFEKKSYDQCAAMLAKKPTPKTKPAKTPARPAETKGDMIRTDSGRWEKMYD
jgi:hypothetical protein